MSWLTRNTTGELDAHLKLRNEVSKDAKKGFCAGGLAVFSEEGGHLRELLHGSGLQRLQGLDRWVAVLQEALRTSKRHDYEKCTRVVFRTWTGCSLQLVVMVMLGATMEDI